MGILLLAALIGVPLIEIGLFIEVGGYIGLWPTLALVVATAIVGSWKLRMQGLATLARGREQLDRGELPARELFDGFCLVIAGALLLTPGFLTDAVGLALFLPPFRDMLRTWLARRLEASSQTRVWVGGEEIRPDGQDRRPQGGDRILEAEYRDVSDRPRPGGPSADDDGPEGPR